MLKIEFQSEFFKGNDPQKRFCFITQFNTGKCASPTHNFQARIIHNSDRT